MNILTNSSIKKIYTIISFFLVVLLQYSPLVLSSDTNVIQALIIQNNIYVDDDNTIGPWDGTRDHPFNTIESAIENAQDYDHIYVYNGTYYEHLIIDKSIILEGENQENVILDGNYSSYIIEVKTSFVKIEKIKIINSGGSHKNAGILLKADTIQISNCLFIRTRIGISLDHSKNIKISNCLFYKTGKGIFLNLSSNSTIINSYFTQNGIGIYADHSNDLTLINCSATVNGIGIFFNDVTFAHIDRSTLYNNNDNQGGLFFNHCQKISVNNSHIYHNGFGVKTDTCSNISINNCSFEFNTHFGMHIANQTTSITVNNTDFVTNLRISIYVENSEIIIHNSNLYGTLMGIYALNAICNVQNNYWGSPLGPAFFDRQYKDRIYSKQTTVNWVPWHYSIEKSAGATGKVNIQGPNIYFDLSSQIIFEDRDTDVDGIPDWWENIFGYDPFCKDNHSILDPDSDGLTNIQECYAYKWGADPFKKDVFLEIDWMESQTNPVNANKPSDILLSDIIKSFAAHNISLHVDVGELGGGEIIPYKAIFTYADLCDYYWEYFLHNNLNNPRKSLFHYGLICDVGPGAGFAFIGWDNLDSFCISADMLGEKLPFFSRDRFIIGGLVHELGHTLGLNVDDHGGNDNKITTITFSKQWFLYLPYRSCMNYWYTYKILTFSDGRLGPTDFNDWEHMDFSFFKNTYFTLPDRYG